MTCQLLALAVLAVPSSQDPSHASLVPGSAGPLHAQRWADVDRDGRVDLYVLHASGEDRLFRNVGDGSFLDVTDGAGLSGNVGTRDAAFHDFDRDENPDLLVLTRGGGVRLYRGTGTAAFVLSNADLGLPEVTGAVSARWTDYDGDGWVDVALELQGGAPMFLHNLDGLGFEAVRLDLGFSLAGAPGGAGVVVVETPSPGGPDRPSRPRAPSSGGGRTPLPPAGASAAAGGTSPTGTRVFAPARAICADRMVDQTSSACIEADSTPTLGALYPLSQDFNLDGDGDVGMGTATPLSDLHVVGEPGLGTLQVSPDSASNGDSRILLSEQGAGTLGFSIRNDGLTNKLKIFSQSGGGESGPWLTIARFNGAIGIGTDDVAAGTGDIRQPVASDGLVKAAAHVDGSAAAVTRQFTQIPGNGFIFVTRESAGSYRVNFGVDVSDRFYQATLGNAAIGVPAKGSISVTPASGFPAEVFVETYSVGGSLIDNDFYLLIY